MGSALKLRVWERRLGPEKDQFAFVKGDRVIALYDVPLIVESNTLAVFDGVLSAMFDVQ